MVVLMRASQGVDVGECGQIWAYIGKDGQVWMG